MRCGTMLLAASLALALAGNAQAIKPQSGWVEAWAGGVVLNEVQPGTTSPCDPTQECEVTAQGSGNAKNFFNSNGELGSFTFTADLFDDLTTSTSNATGGVCHPVGGTITVTTGNGILLLDIEGQHCAVGGDFSLSLITATYFVDPGSGGAYAGAKGVGNFSWSTQVGSSRSDVLLSFSGNLHL